MGVLESYPRITPFLWFNNNAEDAVNFYLSVFKNSRRLEVLHHNGDHPGPANVLTIAFELDGQQVESIDGETIWQVANRQGREIPHLCQNLD